MDYRRRPCENTIGAKGGNFENTTTPEKKGIRKKGEPEGL